MTIPPRPINEIAMSDTTDSKLPTLGGMARLIESIARTIPHTTAVVKQATATHTQMCEMMFIPNARRPSDPSSATAATSRADGNRDASPPFAAAHD